MHAHTEKHHVQLAGIAMITCKDQAFAFAGKDAENAPPFFQKVETSAKATGKMSCFLEDD